MIGVMTILTSATVNGSDAIAAAEYRPGVCNIGPREIRRRRRTGHVGLAATVAILAVLLAIDAPPVARLLISLPAMISASGYLQAWLKFCAGFASIGIYNFGETGDSVKVVDDAARAADRRRGLQISIASFAVGAAVGVLAALLPL
jgi:ferric-dicitrate binding protein FerR (iron transport regulator)